MPIKRGHSHCLTFQPWWIGWLRWKLQKRHNWSQLRPTTRPKIGWFFVSVIYPIADTKNHLNKNLGRNCDQNPEFIFRVKPNPKILAHVTIRALEEFPSFGKPKAGYRSHYQGSARNPSKIFGRNCDQVLTTNRKLEAGYIRKPLNTKIRTRKEEGTHALTFERLQDCALSLLLNREDCPL